MNLPHGKASLLAACVLLLASHGLTAQKHAQASEEYVPLPDPGYGLFYHDADDQPNVATRWGYHDGWEDGRKDRNHGETVDPKTKTRYVRPPEHDLEGRIDHDTYEKQYRQSYQHGYEHGSRI